MSWKDDVYELLKSNDAKDFGEALRIKRENLPQKLYRYRPVTDENIKLRKKEILLGEIYLSHPDELNDPFEGWSVLKSSDPAVYANKEIMMEYYESIGKVEEMQHVFENEEWFDALIEHVAKESVSEDKIQEAKEKLMKISMSGFEDINADMNKMTRKMVRIACFSTSPKNLPMWHHYTNGHTGICLEYDIGKIERIYNINSLFPVYYVEKLPDMTNLVAQKRNLRLRFFDFQSIHKLEDWSYEKEWRLLYNAGSWYYSLEEVPPEYWEKGKSIIFSCPTKIILGKNISDEHEKQIRRYAEMKNIPVVKAMCTEYGLDFV